MYRFIRLAIPGRLNAVWIAEPENSARRRGPTACVFKADLQHFLALEQGSAREKCDPLKKSGQKMEARATAGRFRRRETTAFAA